MRPVILVSRNKINELGGANNALNISENRPVRSVFVNRVEYVPVGSVSSGVSGFLSVTAYRAIPFMCFTGDPYTYEQHLIDVSMGIRERGYTGIIVRRNGVELVLDDPVDFKPNGKETTQLSLF